MKRALAVFVSLILLSAWGFVVAVTPPAAGIPAPDPVYLEAPAGDRYTHVDPAGETVLPNGRLLTPLGRQIPTAPHPFGLALSPDGSVLVTVNGGVVPFSLTVVRDPEGEARVSQIPAGSETDSRRLPSAFRGAAVDAKRGLIYASGGDTGVVAVFSLESGARLLAIDLSTAAERDSF